MLVVSCQQLRATRHSVRRFIRRDHIKLVYIFQRLVSGKHIRQLEVPQSLPPHKVGGVIQRWYATIVSLEFKLRTQTGAAFRQATSLGMCEGANYQRMLLACLSSKVSAFILHLTLIAWRISYLKSDMCHLDINTSA